ncbi:helix-turn-helix transcriptional regulator [Micromonospora sp. NPDC050397]|uniref:helix-turn-helix transcriptional regulator n=1 Tax=Micromonospora sp. NPDC050397 TaxID=3364279 RepID=UPI00384D34F6
MTLLVDTTDPDVVHDTFAGMYSNLTLDIDTSVHRFRLSRYVLDTIVLDHLAVKLHMTATGGPLGIYQFGHVIAGTITLKTPDHDQRQGPGSLYIPAQPDHSYHCRISDAEVEGPQLPVSLFAEIADTEPARVSRPVRFLDYRPINAEAAAIYHRSFDYVRDEIIGRPVAEQPLVAGTASRLLAAAALTAFPNNALHDPTIEDRHDAHAASLRRAVTFIDDNAHLDISPADIAAAAHVTIRALQLAFRRHLDTTPTAYLRQVRLHHAHHDLRDADPATTTATTVAARWGFVSQRRFAAHYRVAYGVTPSHTLRQR